MVVPSFPNSSAFSFPQIPVWAAIHLRSKVLVVPRSLKALRHSMTVLLLMLSVVMAWIEDRLSVQMMICLFLFDVRWEQASVIAVSSA